MSVTNSVIPIHCRRVIRKNPHKTTCKGSQQIQAVLSVSPVNTCFWPTRLKKKLEETKLCITDVYEEVRKFKMKMLQRKQDNFFGYQTKQLMDKQLPAQKSKQQEDFLKFYDSVIAYIDKWFDFSQENVMVKLKPLGLYEELSFTGAHGGCPQTDRDSQYGPTLWRVLSKPGGNTHAL